MKDIKQLREKVGIKQFEMAERLGMNQSNYCNIENGRMVPGSLDVIRERIFAILIPELDKLISENHIKLIRMRNYRKTFGHIIQVT